MSARCWFIIAVALFTSAGCTNTHKAPTTQSATDIPIDRAEIAYWFDQPAIVSTSGPKFYDLWKAAEHTARDYQFVLDRQDQRSAMLTTQPLLSKQLWEIWRFDTPDFHDQLISSMAMVRRSIHFEFVRDDDGTYRVSPKVVVEQLSAEGHRISSESLFTPAVDDNERVAEGRTWPAVYWYAVGRDHDLERLLAKNIASKVESETK